MGPGLWDRAGVFWHRLGDRDRWRATACLSWGAGVWALCGRRGGFGGLFPEDGGGRHCTPHRALASLVIASRPGRSFHFPPVGSKGGGEPKWPGAGTLPSLCLEISLHSFFPIHFPLRLNSSVLPRSLICSTHIF